MKVERARWGTSLQLDYRMVNRIMCSPEGGYTSERSGKEVLLAFQKYVNFNSQEQ